MRRDAREVFPPCGRQGRMIPDTHVQPADWGVWPVLFSAGPVEVSAYGFFVVIGLVVAIALYFWNTRGKRLGGNGLVIAISAVVGGIIGAKIPLWLANAQQIIAEPTAESLLSGRTILGGLIGGALAVWLVKRRLGIRERLGNYLVPSLCLAILFGRIGCLMAGCCYGQPTSLPSGIDFGDGIARHPTQLYEAALMLVFFAYAQYAKERWRPGALFRAFMVAYFAWRFAIEFIRVNPVSAIGLTYYQLTAVIVLLYYLSRSVIGYVRRSPA